MVQTSTRGENYCVLRMLKILCVLLKVIILTRAIEFFEILPDFETKSFLDEIPSINEGDFEKIASIQKEIASIPQDISSLNVDDHLLPNINDINDFQNYIKNYRKEAIDEEMRIGWFGRYRSGGNGTAGDVWSSDRTSGYEMIHDGASVDGNYGTGNYGTVDDGIDRTDSDGIDGTDSDGTGATTEPTESMATKKTVHDRSGGNVNGSDGIGGDGIISNVPSAPGIPVSTILPNFTYYLKWEPAECYDLQVTLYRLEGLIVENNYKESHQIDKHEHWNLYYNGTNNYWITTRDMNQKYRFRVQAENAYGRGVWSESSAIVGLTESTIKSIIASYMIYMLVLFSCVAITACCAFYIYCYSSSVNSAPNSMHYFNLQNDLDEFPRIKIERKQITLGKLIGLGNFGEVYQGIVEILEISKTVLVAIKVLREDSTAQQKNEFIKEANIMSHFDHIHVLRLLGICNETMDSPWLILELMEAGDLLTYLRESRALQPSDPHALRLKDLLAMCEDVARGCRYLEEQHYVHRDLACRNCLISARDREHRIVKISDFGLARDIYEKDYYRMGKGTPLPVRWMAPESLKEKKFSSQSDVWAFGVLMWEITSLGQQPYADIDNCNVKEHVCAGNKLLKPHHCPEKLYNLMLSCWNIANDRPNFKSCLETIETLKNEIEDTNLHLLPPSEISEYVRVEILPEAQPTETTVLLNV